MFGQARVFGRKGTSADSVPADRGEDRVFPRQLWDGPAGNLLRSAGIAPDDPINILRRTPMTLDADRATLERFLDEIFSRTGHPVGAAHMLPPSLWETGFRGFLLERLDLSPYRPWNTVILPLTQAGADAAGLPILPGEVDADLAVLTGYMTEVVRLYQGEVDDTERVFAMTLGYIRQNHPAQFPADREGLSAPVREARANVRALALVRLPGIELDVLIRSRATFLSRPEIQLID